MYYNVVVSCLANLTRPSYFDHTAHCAARAPLNAPEYEARISSFENIHKIHLMPLLRVEQGSRGHVRLEYKSRRQVLYQLVL